MKGSAPSVLYHRVGASGNKPVSGRGLASSNTSHTVRRPKSPAADDSDLVPLGPESVHAFGHLRQRRDAETLAQALALIAHIIVRDGRVRRDAVVPQRDRPVVPLDSSLDVLALGDMLQRHCVSTYPQKSKV